MFELFKKKKPGGGNQSDNPISEVAAHLRAMGYDMTDYGAGVAVVEMKSGYSAVATASHLAHTTLALDIREAGSNFEEMMSYVPHGTALLEVLKEYKDRKMLEPTQWQNDSRAVLGIVTIDANQEKWLARVLAEPIAGKRRVARSRIANKP